MKTACWRQEGRDEALIGEERKKSDPCQESIHRFYAAYDADDEPLALPLGSSG